MKNKKESKEVKTKKEEKVFNKKFIIILSSVVLLAIIIGGCISLLLSMNGGGVKTIRTSNGRVKIAKSETSTIEYETYDNSLISLKIPKGWKVEVAPVDYIHYSFKVYNPNDVNYAFVFTLKLSGFLKSEKARVGYSEGQEMVTDVVGDIVSGMGALGVYSLSVAVVPFTGGASLLFGAGAAMLAGGAVKSLVKFSDTVVGGRSYNSFGRDMITGAFSGILAPISGGLGGAVVRGSATKAGLIVAKMNFIQNIISLFQTVFLLFLKKFPKQPNRFNAETFCLQDLEKRKKK